MKISQEEDGSINIILLDKEIKAIKENNNTFHLDVKRLKNSMNILFHHLFEINKKLPKELQGLSTSLEKEDKL